MIIKGIGGEELPVYGDGRNVRDWLYVDDHAHGLVALVSEGVPGESYAFGGGCEIENIELVKRICELLDRMVDDGKGSRLRLIRFVADRPGHDRRYSIDHDKAERELRWSPRKDFQAALEKTVLWYLEHRAWWEPLCTARDTMDRHGLASGSEE